MLLPGFPLRYDLVSVPRPVLGEDALGLGDRLPRAIPLDAAVAVLAKVLPDDLITQLLGLLALTLAGWGVAVLTPAPLPGRLLALLVAEWNPFVLEQLAIGHVPHLFAYGALPWVAIFGRALVRAGSGPRPGPDPDPDPDRGPGSGGRSGTGFGGGRPRAEGLRAWGGLTAAAGFGSLTPGGGALVVVAGVAGLLAGWFSAPSVGPGSRPSSGLDGNSGSGVSSGAGGGRGRRALVGVVTLGVLQLPWLVAAAAAPAFAAPSGGVDDGITAFALRSETGWGRLVDAAGLAGMWNQAALPASRDTVLARVSTVLLLVLAAAGLPAVRRLWRAGHRAELLAAAGAAAVGYLVAVLPVLPGGEWVLRTMIDVLPGAGLLRDGHRWLGLPAVVLAVLCGLGVSELAGRLAGAGEATTGPGAGTAEPGTGTADPGAGSAGPGPGNAGQWPGSAGPGAGSAGPGIGTAGPGAGNAGSGTGNAGAGRRVGVALFAALLVVASIPDLAGGLAGSLRARHYPAQWAQIRVALDRFDDRGRVLVLPWQPFRVFSWSGPDPVLDPAPRLLPRQSIVSDALTVSGRRLPEEGLGARVIATDLADGELTDARLRSLAVGWVLIERGTPGRLPVLPAGWTPVLDGPELTLLRAPEPLPSAPRAGAARTVAVIGTQVAAGLLVVVGLSVFVLISLRRRLGRSPAGLRATI